MNANTVKVQAGMYDVSVNGTEYRVFRVGSKWRVLNDTTVTHVGDCGTLKDSIALIEVIELDKVELGTRVAVRGEGNGVVTEVNGNVSVALDDGTTVHVAASDVSEIDDEPAIVQADTEALTNTDANGGNGTGDVLAYSRAERSRLRSLDNSPVYVCGWTNGNTESPCSESAPNDASYCPEHERVSAERRNRLAEQLGDRPYDLNKATDACESSIVRDAHDAATARGLTGAERRTYVANYANNCQENAESQYRAEIERVRAATGYRSITPNDWRADVADRVGLTHRAHMNNWEYVGVQTDYGKVFARANYRVAVAFIPGGRVAGAVRINMDKLRSDSVEHTDNYNTIARWLDETPRHHGTGAQFDAESGRVATVTYTYQRIASNTDNPTYTNETVFGYLTRNGASNVFRALLRSARAESATTLATHVTIDETASGIPIKATVKGVTEGIRWRVTIENDRHYGTFVWDESSIGERRIVVPRKVERNRP